MILTIVIVVIVNLRRGRFRRGLNYTVQLSKRTMGFNQTRNPFGFQREGSNQTRNPFEAFVNYTVHSSKQKNINEIVQ